MEITVLIGLLLFFILLGMPLYMSIGSSSLLTIIIFYRYLPLEIVPQYIVGGVDNFTLLAIPFFFLAGEVMNAGGLTKRILRFSEGVIGGIPGGLAHVNISTSFIFSGITGSAIADSAAIGSVLIPPMKKSGYSSGFASAITATSSSIGPIMPPSVPMIIYAMIANVSVSKLFLAGVFPAVLLGIYLMVFSIVVSIRRNYPKSKRLPIKEIFKLGFSVIIALFSPLIILGGIIFGVFTATEAGAIATLYSFLAGYLIYRELSLPLIIGILRKTFINTGSVLILIAISSLFGFIIAQANLSEAVANIIFSISENPVIVLIIINIFLLLIGMIMDPLAALVIFVPVFLPIAEAIGFSAVHFGLIVVLNLMIGLSTPPIGYLLYITSSIEGCPVEHTIREALPFIAAMLLVLITCMFWSDMVLYLPNLLGK